MLPRWPITLLLIPRVSYWDQKTGTELTEAVEREETMLTDLFDMECRDGKLVPLERKK